jgi:elongation factor Ts
MAGYTAADVKRLREDTGAPMMECKSALDEAEGDFERAKTILREKGMAAAGKKAGRATSEGVVAFALSGDKKTIGIAVVECETDFVSKNEDFVSMSQAVADYVLANGAPAGSPMDDDKFKEFAAEIVAKFRENVQITKAVRESDANPIATYIHHDRKSGTVIFSEGDNAGAESVRKVAVHAAAFPPQVLAKSDLSQEMLDKEIEIETKRAMDEGKPENIARNIAQGRVNKDYVKQIVLLEQPFYLDPSKTVSQYISEEAKGTTITKFHYFAVGQNS